MSALVHRSRVGLARYVNGIRTVPLVRNAYSLVGATLVTSGVGVLFWIVAAHAYSTAEVGTDAALISAMTFLSRVAQLNLANGFNRFVPTAGTATRRLVGLGYAAALAVAAGAGVVFVLGAGVWAPKLAILGDDPWRAAWFVVATMVWTLFVLQDSVLTGLGEAPWVLLENAVYGVLKLVALVVVAITLPRTGVFLAWTVPLLLLVVPVSALLFDRFIPRRQEPPSEDIALRPIARFVSADFAATTLLAATSGLMPLIVLAALGARASAYLYLAWSIAYTIHFLGENVGQSLVTEAARDQERIVSYARKALVHSLRIVVPLALAITVAAPFVLRAFGSDYAAHATGVLRLLTLSAIPTVVVLNYLSVARVRRRMGMIVAVTTVESVSILVLATVLLHVLGLAGVGWAWLATDTTLAVGLLLGDLRTLWMPWLRPHALGAVADRGRRVARRHAARAACEAAAETLERSGLAARGWTSDGPGMLGDDVYLVELRSRASGERGVLKLGMTGSGADLLAHRTAALRFVRAVAPAHWLTTVPRVVVSGDADRWVLETRCPGVDARAVLAQPGRIDALLDAIVARMADLYRSTAGREELDEQRLAALVDAPLHATERAATTRLRELADAKSAGRARAELHDQLAARTVTTAAVHGNLWLGNVLWSPANGLVTGIVDWTSTTRGLPVVDVVHLACSTRALEERREIGDVVRDLLDRDTWPDREARLLRHVPGGTDLAPRAVALLAWLQHVAGRAPGEPQVWIAHNVHKVLEDV